MYFGVLNGLVPNTDEHDEGNAEVALTLNGEAHLREFRADGWVDVSTMPVGAAVKLARVGLQVAPLGSSIFVLRPRHCFAYRYRPLEAFRSC